MIAPNGDTKLGVIEVRAGATGEAKRLIAPLAAGRNLHRSWLPQSAVPTRDMRGRGGCGDLRLGPPCRGSQRYSVQRGRYHLPRRDVEARWLGDELYTARQFVMRESGAR